MNQDDQGAGGAAMYAACQSRCYLLSCSLDPSGSWPGFGATELPSRQPGLRPSESEGSISRCSTSNGYALHQSRGLRSRRCLTTKRVGACFPDWQPRIRPRHTERNSAKSWLALYLGLPWVFLLVFFLAFFGFGGTTFDCVDRGFTCVGAWGVFSDIVLLSSCL